MHYGVVDAQNKLTHYRPIPLPGPRLPHDMAFTENYVILNDFPLFWDATQLAQNRHVVRLHELPSRFAIVPRHGDGAIRWFEAKPTFVLHWINAYEDGDEIVLDGYFQSNPEPGKFAGAPEGYEHMMGHLDEHTFGSRLHRWRFNLSDGTTKEEALDERILEFGTINQNVAGRKNRYAYSTTSKPGCSSSRAWSNTTSRPGHRKPTHSAKGATAVKRRSRHASAPSTRRRLPRQLRHRGERRQI